LYLRSADLSKSPSSQLSATKKVNWEVGLRATMITLTHCAEDGASGGCHHCLLSPSPFRNPGLTIPKFHYSMQ